MVFRRTFIGAGLAAGGLAAIGGTTAFGYSSAIASAGSLIDPSLSKVIPPRFNDLMPRQAPARR